MFGPVPEFEAAAQPAAAEDEPEAPTGAGEAETMVAAPGPAAEPERDRPFPSLAPPARRYLLPPPSILRRGRAAAGRSGDHERVARQLVETLGHFGIEARSPTR